MAQKLCREAHICLGTDSSVTAKKKCKCNLAEQDRFLVTSVVSIHKSVHQCTRAQTCIRRLAYESQA